jgi:transposase
MRVDAIVELVRRAPYDKQAVIADIAEQKLTPSEIADKYGITVGNVYTIKSAARRGRTNTLSARLKEEARVFTPEIREYIKDLREKDLTTTEIVRKLARKGLSASFDDVLKVMSRPAIEAAQHKLGKRCG